MSSISGTTAVSIQSANPLASAEPFIPERKQEKRDFHYSYSESLPSILAGLKSSLLITTYTTGNLVSVSQQHGKIIPSFHAFDRPMGVAVKENGIAVGSRNQIWFLRSAPDITAKLEPRGHYDAGFLTRHSHYTGDIHCHDL